MRNYQKGFIVPLVWGIVALLAIGLGSYIYINQRSHAPVTNQQVENNVATTTNSVTSSSTQDQSSTVTFSVSGNNLYVLDDGKNIQTLSLDKSGIFALNTGNNISAFIIDKDVNFDGYNDVGVLASTGYGGVNYFYDFYVFNPSTKRLEKNTVLTGISFTSIDSSKKQIISTYKSGPGYVTDVYQWNGSTFVNSTQNQTSNISVPDTRQYTDSDFGFSFWYPSNWTVSEKKVIDPTDKGYYQNGSISKILNIADSNLPSNGVTIEEFSSPTLSITELGQTKTASPVGVDQKYFFDTNLHTWMYENLTETPSGNRSPGTITPADVSNNTMGGLHIFSGAIRFGANSIVPLSAKNFLIVSINSPTNIIRQNYLVNTILATDPTVATPWSKELQTQTIQAEKSAYSTQDQTLSAIAESDILNASYPIILLDNGKYGSQHNTTFKGIGTNYSVTIPYVGEKAPLNEYFWISSYEFTDSTHQIALVQVGGSYGASGIDNRAFKVTKPNGQISVQIINQ